MFNQFFNRLFGLDERFVMHRYYSTRLATIVGTLLMVLWFNYEYFAHHILRMDLFIIMVVMALVKVGAMLYYSRTQ